jgi:hypothetical protein
MGAGGMSVSAGGSGGIAGAQGWSGGFPGSTGGTPADASTDDAWMPDPGLAIWQARELSPGPSYMGSGDGGCTRSFASIGHAPVDDANGKHPLFLYFVGTSFSADDQSSKHDSSAALKVTEAMARRGFVALSVQYDNTLSLDLNKATCAFDTNKPESMFSIACGLPEVDCDMGIATWGHSQGAALAHGASNYDDRVRAVWTTGYGGGGNALSDTRLRVVNGENDAMNGPIDKLHEAAGTTPADCDIDIDDACLRADGSGWIRVIQAWCEESSADHCWFDKVNCARTNITLEPTWLDPLAEYPWALAANADWVAETVARP